jgi:TATA-box binding protein (TBP) (component of TFIID and TFIIIB)
VRELTLPAVATALQGRCGQYHPKLEKKTASGSTEIISTEEKFPSCVVRVHETRVTASIFTSSQMVLGGAHSAGLALYTAYLIADSLRMNPGFNVTVNNFTVCNVVCSIALGFQLNLAYFATDRGVDTLWQPSKFPGLKWMFSGESSDASTDPSRKGPTFVLFETGRGVLTGGKSYEQLRAVFEEGLTIIRRYRLGHEEVKFDPSEIPDFYANKLDPESARTAKRRRAESIARAHKRQERLHWEELRKKNVVGGVKKPVPSTTATATRRLNRTQYIRKRQQVRQTQQPALWNGQRSREELPMQALGTYRAARSGIATLPTGNFRRTNEGKYTQKKSSITTDQQQDANEAERLTRNPSSRSPNTMTENLMTQQAQAPAQAPVQFVMSAARGNLPPWLKARLAAQEAMQVQVHGKTEQHLPSY